MSNRKLFDLSSSHRALTIHGEGGGGKSGSPEEYPNTLRARNIVRLVEILSEGEIEGPGVDDDWEKSIQLDNGTPIKAADGKYNFKGITVDTRLGLPDQSYMAGFPAAETPVNVGVEVKNGAPGPVVRRINDDVDAVRVTIGTPALVRQDKDGNTVGHSFQFKIEIKADADDPGSAWVEKVNDTFTGKTTSEYRRSYRIALSGGAPYDVRVTRITPDATKATEQNKSTWELYSEIVDRKLTYPDTAVVGLTLNAELFGTSFPNRGYLIKGIKISIPSNYDPITRNYDGEWDGLFVTAWTNNPAWVLYDLITNNRYGCGEWFAAATVDKWGLYQLAQYCDAWNERDGGSTDDYDTDTGKHGVKDGKGGFEPRFTINVTISTREQAYKVLDAVAGMMRTTLLWAGGLISFVQDRPKDGTRLFNQANVIGGEFSYTGTALTARHTVCTVSWNNPAKNYALDTLMVEDREGIKRYGYNQLDLAAYGCTSYGQAYRTALFALYTERLETDTVKFGIGLDNVDVLPGEIIQVADPKFVEAVHGGRLRTVSAGGCTMDRTFTFEPGLAYTITCVTASGQLVKRSIDNPETTTDAVVVTSDFDTDDLPIIGAIFAIESDEVSTRLFRVLSITENQGTGTAEVQALEYISSKFAAIDNNVLTVITKPDFVDLPTPTSILPPEELKLAYSIKLISGVQHGELRVSWSAVSDPYLRHYRIAYQVGDGEWVDLPPTVSLSHQILDPDVTSIVRVVVFSVSNTGLVSQANAAVLNLNDLATVLGKTCIYDLQVAGGGTTWRGRDIFLQWTARSPYSAPPELDGTGERLVSGADPLFKHFRVEVYNSAGSVLLGSFITHTPDFTIPEERLVQWGGLARAYKIKIFFVDRLDADSAPGVLDASNPAPALPAVSVSATSEAINLIFDQPSDADFVGYKVWASTTNGFTPGPGNLVWNSAGRPVLPALPSTTYYFKYAAFDAFGDTGLNVSTQQSITTPASTISGQGALATMNAVTAAVLAAGVGKNCVIDGDFRVSGVTNWNFGYDSGGASRSIATASDLRYTDVLGAGVTVGTSIYIYNNAQYFPVSPGEKIEASVYVGRANTSSVRLDLQFLDASFAYVSQPTLQTDNSSTGAGAGDLTSYFRIGGIATAPSGARYARIIVYAVASSSAPRLRVTRPYLGRASNGQTELTPWNIGFEAVPGADITSANTAAAIAGQGALATLSAVTAAVLAAGVGKNCVIDGDFRYAYWEYSAQSGVATPAVLNANGVPYFRVTGAGVTIGHYIYWNATAAQVATFQVNTGDKVEASLWLGASNVSSFQIFIGWYDNAGAVIAYSSLQTGAPSSAGAGDLSTYQRIGGIATAPANARRAGIVLAAAASSSAPVIRVARPMIAKAGAGQTQISEWNMGFEAVPGADITANSTAAAVTNQGAWATRSNLNVNGGASGSFSVAPYAGRTSSSLDYNYTVWTGPSGTTITVGGGTISGLSNGTKYHVFWDTVGSTLLAFVYAAAASYYGDASGRYLSLGSATTGGGGGGGGGGQGGIVP